MSEEMKPEILPGDLITVPGVYMSRSNCAVEVRGYDHGYWKAEWEDGARWYHSSGQQTGSLVWDDPYQLVRWVGPLLEDIPTTSEQIAEIEERAADYTPPEGWRVLQVGEVLEDGDEIVQLDDGKRYPTYLVGCSVGAGQRYIRRIEPQPEPQADYIPLKGWRALQPGEALQPGDAWHDPQADLFETDLNLTGVAGSHGYYLRRQVCEGRWCTRGGEIRNVTRTPDEHDLVDRFPWWDGSFRNTWRDDGRYTHERRSAFDLLDYLGPITPEPEPQTQPEPQPEPPAESNAEQRVKLLKHANNTQAETIGRLQDEVRDLRTELAEATQERSAQTARIGHLETINSTHAETISGLHSEIHGLNMEIGGLQRERSQKDDRIGYLETMNSGQAAAVRAAGEQNTQLRTLADNARRQLEAAADEISELRKSLDDAEKQLDQKDAQIRDLRIELDAAQQIPKPLTDEQQELIWDQATQEAGEQLIRWLHPLVHALKQQPNERFLSFMAITLSVLPEIVPQLLGYEEDGRGESAEE